MINEKKQVLKQIYYLVNGIWTNEKHINKKDIELIDYKKDEDSIVNYIFIKLFNEEEFVFTKKEIEYGAVWTYRQI